MRRLLAGAATLSALMASSCVGNPYALGVGHVDYGRDQRGGVVTFADPKIFRRESLVNERRDELEYLEGLLKDSRDPTKVKFEPEIVREIEQVSALAFAFGFAFDPASAVQYRRNEETAEIEQQMDVIKLKLELTQLQRDVELWQQKIAAQTEPSTEKQPEASSETGGSAPTPKSADQLATAIAALRTTIETRLGAQVADLRVAKASISPIDAFQQRAAYRNLLQGAINASSLDEMHDGNGATLVRLNFPATVFPPRDEQYSDTFGMLRMTATPPALGADEQARDALYLSWLDYVNATINERRLDGRDRYNARLVAIGRSGEYFDIRYLIFPEAKPAEPPAPDVDKSADPLAAGGKKPSAKPERAGAKPPPVLAGKTQVVATQHPAPACAVSVSYAPSPVASCRSIAFVTPLGVTAADLNSFTFDDTGLDDIRDGNLALAQAADLGPFNAVFAAATGCELNPVGSRGALPGPLALADSMQQSRSALTTLPRAEQALINAVGRSGVDPSKALELQERVVEAEVAAKEHLELVKLRLGRDCFPDEVTSNAFVTFLQDYDQPAAHTDLAPFSRITIYQVGPREESQTVSTVARAADALALAASASASNPAQGQGMSAALSYSRSAIGKVDALERAPLVVSFAEAGADAGETNTSGQALRRFGWILGPRMSLDAEHQELIFDHRPVPHELFVDLSLPGWWPYFTLKSESAWAPEWSADGKTMLASSGKGEDSTVATRELKVWMNPTNADLAGLTTAIAATRSGLNIRTPVITGVSPEAISKCGGSVTLRIWGENLWRATEVVVGGRLISGESVRVLPDMSGIRVTIDKFDFPRVTPASGEAPISLEVTVLTAAGPASSSVAFEKSDDDCEKPKKEPPPATTPKKISIASVSPPQVSICDPSPSFIVTGNLPEELAEVRLGTVRAGKSDFELLRKGTEKEPAIWSVEFKGLQLKSRLAGMLQTPLSVRSKTGEVVALDIVVVNASCN